MKEDLDIKMVNGKYRKAVFIVVYAQIKKEISYLILKRKLHWKGWEFPKGGIKSLESEKKAVKREIKEETGLWPLKGKIKKFNFSGKYPYDKIYPDRIEFIGQTFVLYSAEVKKRKVKISREHFNHKWVNFSKALKMLKWPNQRKSLKIVNAWLNDGKV